MVGFLDFYWTCSCINVPFAFLVVFPATKVDSLDDNSTTASVEGIDMVHHRSEEVAAAYFSLSKNDEAREDQHVFQEGSTGAGDNAIMPSEGNDVL